MGVPVAGKVNKPAITNNNRQSCKIISYKLQIIATYITITLHYNYRSIHNQFKT
jgi:hypothetical protein